MINLLYDSGLVNSTFLAALAICLAAILYQFLAHDLSGKNRVWGRLGRLTRSVPFLIFLGLGTLVNAGYGIYKGYVVPRDFMQDVLSAQGYLQGETLYPLDMTQQFVKSVTEDPPFYSIWPEGSDRRLEEQSRRLDAASDRWDQAHPPLMTLAFVPLVCAFGVKGTYFAVDLVSIAGLLVSLIIIFRELDFRASRSFWLAIALGVLGWSSVITCLRLGQSGTWLGLLVVLGWLSLRKGHPIATGLFIGAATMLKVYPGILLIFLLSWNRRAFISGLVTVAFFASLSVVLCGLQVWSDYFRTARFVTDVYAVYHTNISLLSGLWRLTGGRISIDQIKVADGLMAMAFVALSGWVIRREAVPPEERTARLDRDFSLFLSLAPLLTPIAWDHYLVVLILPIAVLAKAALDARPGAPGPIALTGLLAVFCIPESTYLMMFSQASSPMSRYLLGSTFMNVRTFAMLGVVFLLSRLDVGAFRRIEQVEAPPHELSLIASVS